MTNILEIGQWISAYEGIGKVIYLRDFFVEEYTNEFKNGHKLGDYIGTIVIYKLLCDFEGKLRKRNKILHCSISLCAPINTKFMNIVDNIREKFKNEYEAFENLLATKSLRNDKEVWLNLPEEKVENVEFLVNKFNRDVTGAFNFSELLKFVLDNETGIDADSMLKSYSRTHNNLYITLYNDNFKVKEKKMVLTGLKTYIK